MTNLPDFFNRNSLTGNPLRDLFRMQARMDRALDEMWDSFTPSCDVEETDTHYLMSFDLPGVKRDDIKIDLQDDVLTISGERKEERADGKGEKYRSERFWGAFTRSFQIPSEIKPEMVEAHYSDGVLRVAVPKTEAAKAQQIRISEGKTGFWDKLLGHKKEEAHGPQANGQSNGQTHGRSSAASGPRLQVKAS